MSEAYRSRVTITLGRTGQVVKRAGADLESEFQDKVSSVGKKRSIHDRLGTNVELNSKRRRGNDDVLSTSSADDTDDEAVPLRKDDLRYKIMQKTGKKGTQSGSLLNGVDLREMLSTQARASKTSAGTQQLIPEEKNGRHYIPDRSEVRQLVSDLRSDRQHMPEARDIRHQLPDTREVRQRMPEMREYRERMPETREYRERMPETRDVRERIPETWDVRERIPETREIRERMPETREVRERMPETREVRERMPETREVRDRIPYKGEVRQHMPETREVRQHMPESRDDRRRMTEPTGDSIMRRVPSMRGANPVPEKDSFRNSYSPLTSDRLRRRSPDGVLGNSRGASPPRSQEELRIRPLMRSYDDVRSAAYSSRDGLHVPRPMGSTSYMTNSTLAPGPAKPVGQMLAAAPPGVIMHKSSYTVNEQHSVEGLLRVLSLEKYIINFKAEEVDMHALRQMGDNDLKDLGIPMGPRKKILLALLPRSRRQM